MIVVYHFRNSLKFFDSDKLNTHLKKQLIKLRLNEAEACKKIQEKLLF